jgi:hypothetical protein
LLPGPELLMMGVMDPILIRLGQFFIYSFTAVFADGILLGLVVTYC